ncbi:signal recognition particle-docking protein FtsY [Candidatus Nitrosopumilus salaria BD31]|uniref:Signal recognition particle receptor FtsY n=1 Tax=Candidatus Nitrosopumilus salarius BD31 TaxID=859350 RepID=I3D123_9ARCH|nr:signal recognition particle-docking protein FtsY [Candidatus Nitrosopumilus salaria]EIJ65416.1 signal recognition particle-docking protein FtsY [Candidatus Nitrosopumilus salaria BD31]
MFDFFKKNKTPDTEQKSKVEPQTTEVEEQKTLATPPVVEAEKLSLAERLKRGLSKTRQQLGGQLSGLFSGGKIDEETYEELETILLTSDIGVAATQKLLDALKARVKKERLEDTSALKEALKAELISILSPLEVALEINNHQPFVIMLAGVNGAGKTTSIGKLAKLFQAQGKSVLIAAGDTFRAAAREQLQVWGERNNVHVVTSEGADAAAVIFDAVNSAIAKKIDIVIADTAGRLPTQMHLMDEIAKVKRVINKALTGAPHEVMLVLDANTGQNAVSQVKAFDDALSVTGLILSKLDGSAKGGVIAAIAEERPIPIRFIGVGEAIDDLRPFKANDFVNALFDS